jgi:hypothetical protein
VLIALAVVAAIVGLVGWQFFREKKLQNDLFVWHRLALYKRGSTGVGTILDRVEVRFIDGGTRRLGARLVDLVVDVRVDGAPTRRISMRYALDSMQHDRTAPGAVVPIRFDPELPSRVMIDWRALERASDVAASDGRA